MMAGGFVAMPKDPVCEEEVESFEFSGFHHPTTYYFCSKGCQREFENDPAFYHDRAVNEAKED